jgi:hypothetical protein
MLVRYVGMFDEVEVEIAGRAVVVKNGDTIDAPPAVAGRAPSERWLEVIESELPAVYTDHAKRSALLDELVTLDAGEGLLAQYVNWAPVAPAKKKDTTP